MTPPLISARKVPRATVDVDGAFWYPSRLALNSALRPLPLAKAAPPTTATRAMTTTAPNRGSFLMPNHLLSVDTDVPVEPYSGTAHPAPTTTALESPIRQSGGPPVRQSGEPRFVTGPNHIEQ